MDLQFQYEINSTYKKSLKNRRNSSKDIFSGGMRFFRESWNKRAFQEADRRVERIPLQGKDSQ